MKYIHLNALFLMFVFHTSCGQNQTNVPKDNIYSEPKDTVTSYGPNTMVRNVKQDRNGNILIAASWGGVFRYDGKSFQNSKEGLFLEDKTGKLWCGAGGGAGFYEGKTFTVLTHKGKPFRNVRTIIEDKKSNIWLGGSDGLWRYDGSTFINFTQKFVGYVYEDSKGNIWTTGEVKPNGDWALSRYDQKSLYNKNPAVTEIMSTEKMLCGILEANDGSIWFGSLYGVYRYDGKTITDFRRKEDQK